MVTTLMTPTVDLTGPADAAVLRGTSVSVSVSSVGHTTVPAASYPAGSWTPQVEGPGMSIRRDDAPFGGLHTDLSTPSHLRVNSRELPV